MIWHRHKWGMWTRVEYDVYHKSGLHEGQLFQERACSTCGYVENRPL